MASLTTKRIIAAGVGLFYAFVYGVWTLMLTGGGHGNFIWFFLFFSAGLLGFYYPVMAFLVLDLRPLVTRVISGSLIGFNLTVSVIWIIKWVTELDGNRPTDFQKMWQMAPGWVLFAAFVHFLPTVIFLFFLVRSIMFGTSLSDDDQSLSLNLN